LSYEYFILNNNKIEYIYRILEYSLLAIRVKISQSAQNIHSHTAMGLTF
jgi:hypothetical protein